MLTAFDGPLTLPWVSNAVTVYVYVVPADTVVSLKVVFGEVPMAVPLRVTVYPATPIELVDAVHERSTSALLTTVAARPVGAVGGAVPVDPCGTTSMAARSHMSFVGAVSLMVTAVPALGVAAL